VLLGDCKFVAEVVVGVAGGLPAFVTEDADEDDAGSPAELLFFIGVDVEFIFAGANDD
jgi:hypothetical protein